MYKIIEKYLIFRGFELIILLLLSLFLLACEAPRNNPLDPQNTENSGLVSIEGNVKTFKVPYTAIQGVSVFWLPEGIGALTDENGNFVFSNIKPVNGNLVFQKEGFISDTIFVLWQGEAKISEQVNLNSIPVLDSLSVYSVTIFDEVSGPVTDVHVSTKIIDEDNNIDSVFVESSQLNFSKAMDYNVVNQTFQTTISDNELNAGSIANIIGVQFSIVVKDKTYGRRTKLGGEKITRIIDQSVNINSPGNGQIVSVRPNFQWNSFQSAFKFNYMIEIYTSDLQLVKRIENIPQDASSYQLSDSLDQRDYFWYIWVIDEFNDRSRSKPADFTVH